MMSMELIIYFRKRSMLTPLLHASLLFTSHKETAPDGAMLGHVHQTVWFVVHLFGRSGALTERSLRQEGRRVLDLESEHHSAEDADTQPQQPHQREATKGESDAPKRWPTKPTDLVAHRKHPCDGGP